MAPEGTAPQASHPSQRVPLNVYQTNGALVVVAPLPGVMADDIEVRVEGRTLEIAAGMRTAAEKRDYQLHEWHYGPYHRTLEIDEGFGADVRASFGNGQLAIRVGKGEPVSGAVVIHPDT
jgi:HSP20 family protein